MKINDCIYGKFVIDEPGIISLIETDALQRLKNINQFGMPDRLYHYSGFSRYEHSVGVFLLLRKLSTSKEEQIAGLIHDVSHTALSHVVDWAVGDREREEFHDENHEKYVYETEIPQILSKYGFDTDKILNDENFPLLERNIPELCADRVDYALREFKKWSAPEAADSCFKNLKRYKNKIIFEDKKSAKEFSKNYLRLQTEHWGGPHAVIRYHLLGNALKRALDKEIIEMVDLYEDDEHILNKLENESDSEIQKTLEMLKGDIKYETDVEDPDFSLDKKFRYVDPEYLADGKLKRLSRNDEEYRKLLKKRKLENERGVKIKLIS